MELRSNSNQQVDLIVIGGGPAGFMGAITAAEKGLASVFLFESTSKTLEKVRISGGGRCNVTNACWDPIDLVTNYPRGKLPLLGSFSRFATGDAVAWFADKGLDLVIEKDGRMFPRSNSSLEVVSCLRSAASARGVNSFTKSAVSRVDHHEKKGFLVYIQGQSPIETKRLLLATGGHPSGRKLASSLGHKIVNPVPSLFSLTLEENPLNICSGIALNDVNLKLLVGGKSFTQTGRVLITHRGLSGPAVLRLSAFAARELYQEKYKAQLEVSWIDIDFELAVKCMKEFRRQASRNTLANARPFKQVPRRLWLIILKQAGINSSLRWAEISSLKEKQIIKLLLLNSYSVSGRGPFGEEFVTAGGINLGEVNFARMESRLLPGLHFAGEILDVDGVTGGFNFQHCWSSGWIAGKAIANSLQTLSQDD